jgi:DNA invertase Pin-like site-specific DNA recombinase
MKVYAYLRVSGKGQIVGNGFDRQLETIQAYCERVVKPTVNG